MAGLFERRARASENSWGREEDKARISRMRDLLKQHGYELPEKREPTADAGLTVDVLAEVSAHSIPLGKIGVAHQAPVIHRETTPAAPDKKKRLPQLPSTSAVASEIYSSHLGKGKWINTVQTALTPRDAAGPAVNVGPEALFGLPSRRGAPSARELAQIERQAQASAGAAGAIVGGSVLCVLGASLAGVAYWRWKGRPTLNEMNDSAKATNQERYANLQHGPVGETVRTIAQTAAATIPAHEGLKNWQQAMKDNRATRQ
tara:strand:- start:1821 stop:2600 length:780 start_codon:yes stop_codon:yes gene_type:complete